MPTFTFVLVEDESIQEDIFFKSYSPDLPKIGQTYTDEDGRVWRRTVNDFNNSSGLVSVDPFNSKQFVEKTGAMKGKWGDLESYSAEMSQKRAEKSETGLDPIREKYFEDRKKLTGLEHPEVKRRKAKEDLAKKGVVLE
jgi:hypothetical protein